MKNNIFKKIVYLKETTNMNPVEAAKFYAESCKMTEQEWDNYNKMLNGEDFDETALVETLSDVKAAVPVMFPQCNRFCFGHLVLEVSKKTLLNYCYYYINKENDTLPETLPTTIKQLAECTYGILTKFASSRNLDFAIYMNQNNDKFMCLVNLWNHCGII